MADIPSYVASQNPETGTTGPHATGADFGGLAAEGLNRLGEGGEQGARQAAIGINRMRRDAETRQRFDDNRWAGESYEQEKRVISEFMANPENNQKESFAKDLDGFIKTRMDQYNGDSAPSPRALATFKEQMGSLSTNLYDHALNVGAQNSIKNGVNSVNTQINDAITAYHNSKQLGDMFAGDSLKDSVAHITAGIDSNFGKLAPGVARNLHESLISNAVLAASGTDPALANSVLSWSTKIDESTRKSLQAQIDRDFNARDAVEAETFRQTRESLLIGAENGKINKGLPLEVYESFLPKDKAQVAKMRDDAYIGTMASANKTISDLAPQEASYQLAKLNDLSKNINTEDDKEAYKKIHSEVMANVRLQEHNPVAWLQQYNPVVSHLAAIAADAKGDNQLAAINNLNAAVLKYQGAPPPGTPADEQKQYLNRPIADQHLLGIDDATTHASDLNQANPKEFIQKMGELLQRYPDPQHQMIAFNDMVTLPKGANALKQSYQLAWQNKDAWWLDTYIGALNAGKDIKLPETDRKSIEQHIDSDPTWRQFQSAMIGDNFSRSSEIQGFREGINQYAVALANQGKTLKESSRSAVQMLIGETLGITKVNGRPMVVLRDQGQNTPKMDDTEVKDLGRRLGLALQFVDPREVDQRPFTALQQFGKDEMHVPRLQALRDSITARAFFQTGPDGKSASLYYADDNGSTFQVRDRKNQPFNINFRDLPAFKPKTVTMSGMKVIPGAESDEGGQPLKHYDIMRTTNPDMLFSPHKQYSNFPMHMNFLHGMSEFE